MHLEEELSQLEQSHLLGQIAAGIAHEIRNPMTTVLGYLQLFRKKSEFAGFEDRIDLMIDEIRRANLTIDQLLSLSQNRSTCRELVSLNSLIEVILPKLTEDAALGGNEIVLDLKFGIPLLYVNEEEICQLIIRIVHNGLQAMKKGQLTIRTSLQYKQVVLTIEDQGREIPLTYHEQIGSPFFTTTGNVLGLGLAICHGIAKRNKAIITYKTSPHGTKFLVRFGQPN